MIYSKRPAGKESVLILTFAGVVEMSRASGQKIKNVFLLYALNSFNIF